MIVKAELNDTEIVRKITEDTIKAVYPHFFPEGAVKFFLDHHSSEHIAEDIVEGNVWLILNDVGKPAGTVTVNGYEINRLFVLPDYQGNGYGKALLDHAEKLIAVEHHVIKLSASFPAKNIYLKRGYIPTGFFIIDTDNGDKLCYDYMEKIIR